MSKTYVIIGGVAGGASCAARLRRLDEQARIVLIERGPYVSFANCGLPYHIAGQIPERDSLVVQSPESLYARARIEVHTRTEATNIDPQAHTLRLRRLLDGAEEVLHYDRLVLSPGAAPIRPPLPGITDERIRTLRNIPDMDGIKALVDSGQAKRAVVIGGGYIGLEMTEALVERGLAVHLVELAAQVMGPADPEMAAPLHQELHLHGVDLILGTAVAGFLSRGADLVVQLANGEELAVDLAILAIGVKPETTLAKEAGLALGPTGGIAVNAHLQTSDPHIYAVGDAIEVSELVSGLPALIPLAGPANRQGRIAAEHICGRNSSYSATQGTAVCKVFGLTIGMTGLSEKACRKQGRAVEVVYVHPLSHAEYYPGAERMTLKLLFDPHSGLILGAQAVGGEGVDKRIDVLATAIRAKLKVEDLEHLELSYAPPYGSAKDPVNYAGFVASNVLRGNMPIAHPSDLPGFSGTLLDVSSPAEFQSSSLPGAINIPIDQLRSRFSELSPALPVITYCPAGLRGYLATRILLQAGYQVRNLVGGGKVYHALQHQTKRWRQIPKAQAKAHSAAPVAAPSDAPIIHLNACGLQCPGPILKLKEALDQAQVGQQVRISVSDPGFLSDITAWCNATGHRLVSNAREGTAIVACIAKAAQSQEVPAACELRSSAQPQGLTIVCFSGDWDKMMAAFIIANGAAAMGLKPTLFCTFWGLNVLRRDNPPPVHKTFIEKMFGFMMPRGARKLALSKLHMLGLGKAMIDGICKAKQVSSLPELIHSAQTGGAKLVACTMSMDLMGIKQEELIEGVELGGVAAYLGSAQEGRVNLFI